MNRVCGVLERYVAKIRQFVDGDITACQFEESYLQIFKSEEKILPEDVFEVLNSLFADVDSFCKGVDFHLGTSASSSCCRL